MPPNSLGGPRCWQALTSGSAGSYLLSPRGWGWVGACPVWLPCAASGGGWVAVCSPTGFLVIVVQAMSPVEGSGLLPPALFGPCPLLGSLCAPAPVMVVSIMAAHSHHERSASGLLFNTLHKSSPVLVFTSTCFPCASCESFVQSPRCHHEILRRHRSQ